MSIGAITRPRVDASTATFTLPGRVSRHALHDPSRTWPETNCYTDLWIELLHARGCDPTALFAFTVATDWEGDQWTFFKPPVADLESLYGVEVRELTVWRALPAHLAEHTDRGRVVLVEVDAHFLPDTAGTTYRVGHSKTTVGIDAIAPAARALTYFHNAGHFELSGDDYDGALALGAHARADGLPPYAELAVLERLVRRDPADLRVIARGLLGTHIARLPARNPVAAYAAQCGADVAWLAGGQPDVFHRYAFATLRQCGAAWELAASSLRWLGGAAGDVAPRFDALAGAAHTLQLRLARVAYTQKPADLSAPLAAMTAEWDAATTMLRAVARSA